jgi:hypothetical protein
MKTLATPSMEKKFDSSRLIRKNLINGFNEIFENYFFFFSFSNRCGNCWDVFYPTNFWNCAKATRFLYPYSKKVFIFILYFIFI